MTVAKVCHVLAGFKKLHHFSIRPTLVYYIKSGEAYSSCCLLRKMHEAASNLQIFTKGNYFEHGIDSLIQAP